MRRRKKKIQKLYKTNGSAKDFIVHQSIAKDNDKEVHLPILLSCYPEAAFKHDKSGLLPLHIACIYKTNNLKIIKTIFTANSLALFEEVKKMKGVESNSKNKIDLQIKSNENKQSINLKHKYVGLTPFQIVLRQNANLEILRFFFMKDPRVLDFKDDLGRSVLHIAIQFRANTSAIYFLLSMKDEMITECDAMFNNVLHTACRYGCDEDIIETLVERLPGFLQEINKNGSTPMELAFRYGRCSDEVLDFLHSYIESCDY